MKRLLCIVVMAAACGHMTHPDYVGPITAHHHYPGSNGLFGEADSFSITVQGREIEVTAEQWAEYRNGDCVISHYYDYARTLRRCP